ncbi:hypothetical protein QTJ16_001769 [Diplocarpon rosae]|uniref:Secreted protein n=1 Tax=Diplocarpon rosae TaxID=946125 RepID=A0AAD9WGR1_9HELO|nr:hypothetical protein QTJ16_001769 [Diplocarpon rosae]
MFFLFPLMGLNSSLVAYQMGMFCTTFVVVHDQPLCFPSTPTSLNATQTKIEGWREYMPSDSSASASWA